VIVVSDIVSLRRWLIAGNLGGYELEGRSWRVPPAALRAYLDSQPSSVRRWRHRDRPLDRGGQYRRLAAVADKG
jgi:hypothetical protein